MSLVRGFSLIEAMVALLVLSIAALGLGAMQLKGLQSAQVSYQRSVAVLAAEDAEERLWRLLSVNDMRCPDADALDGIEQQWREDWQETLPEFARSELTLDETYEGCRIDILTEWRDERFRAADGELENVSSLPRVVVLPVVEGETAS